jgi:serine/threonine-protein kinase
VTPEQYHEAARARLGATLKGKWKLDKVLGVGGTASVYAASHRNGKRAAIKVLHPELSAQFEFRERFLREAYVGNHIEHPGALTVHDDDSTEDGCAFLVMDLLEGENLEARRTRKGGKLGPLEVLSLMDAVLDIVQAAHQKGVVHRDIKPENLFVTVENEVRLLDFGVARIDVPEDPSQTLAGISMGTPAFMPPEQASAHWNEVDERSDIWALGASMFVLLTGTYVYRGGTVNESLVQAITGTAPKVQTIEPSVPPLVAQIVDRALEREKSYRYASAAEMQSHLRAAYRELQDGPDDARYSLSDGRVAAHSSPPGMLYGSDDGTFDLHTPDPMAAEAAALRPNRKGALWLSLGALVLGAVLFAWLASTNDEAPASSATPSPQDTAAKTKQAASAPATAASSDQEHKAQSSAEATSADTEPDDPAALSTKAKAANEERKRSSTKPRAKAKRPRPVKTPAPKIVLEPEEEDFDPFAKRH